MLDPQLVDSLLIAAGAVCTMLGLPVLARRVYLLRRRNKARKRAPLNDFQ